MADDDVTFEILDALEEAGEIGELEAQVRESIREEGSRPIKLPDGKTVAERVKVYDRFGNPSMVPTASAAYHLMKKDPQGNRVFFRRPPAGAKQPEPIPDLKCEVCEKRDIHKVFYEEIDWEAHWDTYHPREWAARQRREEREHQAAASTVTAGAVLDALKAMTPAERKALLGGA